MSDAVDFFKLPKHHSIIKSDIVSEYFGAWVEIMRYRCKDLTYLDLFSGAGRYDDGTSSTPIKVFNFVESKKAHLIIKSFFYEEDKVLRKRLEKNLEEHSVFDKLRSKPIISPEEISSEIIERLPISECTLSFVDPIGYEDISARLLASLIKNWGSDCIFYLTTYGIRRNIENASEERDLKELFGSQGLQDLKLQFENSGDWFERDLLILKALENMVIRIKGKPLYFLHFGMQFEDKRLISYYLIFITKHHLGFKLMKDIMSKENRCVLDSSGIPLYYYSRIEREKGTQLGLLLSKDENRMEMLKERMMNDFKGRNLAVEYVIDGCHQKGYFETSSNMISAMLLLEAEPTPRLRVDKPREQRIRKGKLTLGPKRIVTFLD